MVSFRFFSIFKLLAEMKKPQELEYLEVINS